MTREEAKALLPIIQAYAEGKQIEVFSKEFPNDGWRSLEEASFSSPSRFEYRIKPEPVKIERWAVIEPLSRDIVSLERAEEQAKRKAAMFGYRAAKLTGEYLL